MLVTANKQKRQIHYIREGAFAYLQTVIEHDKSTPNITNTNISSWLFRGKKVRYDG